MENNDNNNARVAKVAAFIGRLCLLLSIFSLGGAWVTQATGRTLMGMTQIHLFYDAMSLALIGILFQLNALLHLKDV